MRADWEQSGGGGDDDNCQMGPELVPLTPMSLTTGTPVKFAELRLTSAGATWEKVILAPTSTSMTSTSPMPCSDNDSNDD
jgi:hypothetical protein